MSTCGEKLAFLRREKNLTQKAVAELLHVHRSTYTYYERDRTLPSFRSLLALAKLYGVTVESLVDEAVSPEQIVYITSLS